MQAIIIFTCLLLAINCYVEASYYTDCDIEGWTDSNYGTYTFKVPINDTHRGVIATFKTKNTFRMRPQTVNYLNTTWEDQTLTFFTSDKYPNYEKENSYTNNPIITLKLDVVCTKDTGNTFVFKLPILDNNNHSPIPSRKRYDYVFGGPIPIGFTLTEILPITAKDYDITNKKLSLSMVENDYIKHEIKGMQDTKSFQIILKTKQKIEAPFNQTFTMVITDDGYPARNVSVPITLAVTTPEELQKNLPEQANEIQIKQEDMVHPPVFEKHLYFADYTSNNDFKLEEPLVIYYGAESNTKLKQKGFEKYFEVQFEDSTHKTVTVNKLMSLPKDVIETTNVITIEIEAVNEGLNLPGRTALLIRLPNVGVASGENKECEFTVYSVAHNTTLPLVLFLLAVFSIVFINIYLAVMFVNRTKVQFQRA